MNLIEKIPSEANFEEISNNHHLCGYFYSKNKSFSQFKKAYYLNLHRGMLIQEEMAEIAKHFKGEAPIVLLKGASLIGDIYDDLGMRFMSDIDLLVDKKEFSLIKETLVEQGFSPLNTDKWFANDFKAEFVKHREGIELVIEIHWRIFYHSDEELEFTELNGSGFKVLSREYQFIHLCGHLGFQHNFLKLYWLFDIYHYYLKYENEISWDKVSFLAKKMKVYRSVEICLWLLADAFNLKINDEARSNFYLDKKSYWKEILTYDFLIDPVGDKKSYLLMKHLNKDNLLENFRYNYGWLKKKIGF